MNFGQVTVIFTDRAILNADWGSSVWVTALDNDHSGNDAAFMVHQSRGRYLTWSLCCLGYRINSCAFGRFQVALFALGLLQVMHPPETVPVTVMARYKVQEMLGPPFSQRRHPDLHEHAIQKVRNMYRMVLRLVLPILGLWKMTKLEARVVGT